MRKWFIKLAVAVVLLAVGGVLDYFGYMEHLKPVREQSETNKGHRIRAGQIVETIRKSNEKVLGYIRPDYRPHFPRFRAEMGGQFVPEDTSFACTRSSSKRHRRKIAI